MEAMFEAAIQLLKANLLTFKHMLSAQRRLNNRTEQRYFLRHKGLANRNAME